MTEPRTYAQSHHSSQRCRNPGKQTDDEILYGSGTSSDPVHSGTGNTGTLSGEGSHLGKTTGPHSSNLENKADPRVNSDREGSRNLGHNTTSTETTGYGSGGSSSMPGTFAHESGTESSNLYNSQQTDHGVGENTTAGTSATGHTSHLGRDAAVGAGSEGLAEHERRKHETNTGNDSTGLDAGTTSATIGASGYNSGNAASQAATGGSATGHSSHLGRDAAGVGYAEHEHRKHDKHVDYNATGNGIGNTGTTGDYSSTGPTSTGYGATTGSARDQVLPDRTTGTADHHLGHDSAAIGGAAGVGEGIHHHNQNRENLVSTTTPSGINSYPGTQPAGNGGYAGTQSPGNGGYTGTTSSGTGSAYYGAPTGTAVDGPHITSTANRLDPYVNQNDVPIENASFHDKATGGGAESADLAHGRKPETAALGAIGTGGVALGGHEHHRHDRDLTQSEIDAKREHKHELREEKKHSHDVSATQPSSHHHGRDAAGAGVVGAGVYETGKHEPGYGSMTGGAIGSAGSNHQYGRDNTGAAARTTGTNHNYGKDAAGAGALGAGAYEAEKHHRAREGESGYGSTTGGATGSTGTSHHYGRDTAGAGAIGNTAYEADKHHDRSRKSDEPGYESTSSSRYGENITTGNGPAPKTTGPHKKDWMNKLDPGVDSMAIPTGSTGSHATTTNAGQDLSMNNRNAYVDPAARNNPGFVSGPGAADALGTTAPGTQHHYGRDAAGADAVGAGAYDAEKHRKGRDGVSESDYGSTTKPLPTAPGNHGVGTGPGAQNALIDRSRTDYGNDRTGTGSGHPSKWEGGEGADYAPRGTTLGDKLHGADRNRGVTTGGSEHNRLHKDPPSSHPASQGGVTSDGKYIEPGTGRTLEHGYGSGTTRSTGPTNVGYGG